MDFTSILPYAVLAFVTVLAWFLMSLFSNKESQAMERLDELRDPRLRERDRESQRAVESMLEKAAPKLSVALQPKSELEQNELKIRLANAGFNSANAPNMFLTIKLCLLVGGLIAGGGLGVLKWGLTQNGITSIVVAGAIGFYLPDFLLGIIRRGRQERIFLSMPDALDLLVVCVEAGLGLDAGMRRVSEELSDTAPDVCYEMAAANMQLQMGRPRREVLHDLGVRTGVDDMRALSAILIQADKFGSSIAQALRVQSDSMRVKRRQMAEEKAQQTAVKMIFPLVLFIFPGIFVVLVGPAAIMMLNGLLKQ